MAFCCTFIRSDSSQDSARLKKPSIHIGCTPKRLHSDQGRNFESQILSELCKAFRVTKIRTTLYHPMGDGLVERMNRSILSLLRGLVEKEKDWEEHLQLLLYLYRTTQQVSPHMRSYANLIHHY